MKILNTTTLRIPDRETEKYLTSPRVILYKANNYLDINSVLFSCNLGSQIRWPTPLIH